MVVYSQDKCKLVLLSDGDVIATESDKSGRVAVKRANGDSVLIGEYTSGYVARAVIADIYAAAGATVKYQMPTMSAAKKIYSASMPL